MSFADFVDKCGTWGLLPNNDKAKGHYSNMKVMGALGPLAGFSRKLKKLCINIPDLSGVGSLGALKSQGAGTRISVVVVCHEIFHFLHFLVDEQTFVARSNKTVDEFDNEEELLTITGDTGQIALPDSIQVACQPKLFNENSLCKILNLTLRSNHHTGLADNTTQDTVDLSAIPNSVTSYAEIWGSD
ncbi:MAG: hypothetical protein IH605_14625 [Burkholderiales bacterium]|nr:hypothetical protein [Burkholderiales bacterium]